MVTLFLLFLLLLLYLLSVPFCSFAGNDVSSETESPSFYSKSNQNFKCSDELKLPHFNIICKDVPVDR
jgi:hypothetical protein